MVAFLQFKKGEKDLWRSVTFSKVAVFEIIQMVPNREKHLMAYFHIFREKSCTELTFYMIFKNYDYFDKKGFAQSLQCLV